jgi:UPF0755 protein
VEKIRSILLRLLLTITAVVAVSLIWLIWTGLRPVAVNDSARFTVEKGQTLHSVAQSLERESIVPDAISFQILALVFNAGQRIKAGVYEFENGSTSFQVLQKLIRGYFVKNKIRLQEGWTFWQVRDAIDNAQALRHDTKGLSNTQILKLLNIEEEHPEGLFYPDTYTFSGGESDLEILRIANEKLKKTLVTEWKKKPQKSILKASYEALVLASIIEKETSLESEKTLISAVFHNRLRKQMRLQADPTVIYGIGPEFNGNITRNDLREDTLYNTYTRDGLPPTPIAMVTRSSIRAAINPIPDTALYFVAKGDGSHHFSDNLSDHNKAVQAYQR